MTYIQTFTGRKFYPLDPNPQDVHIEDIAHALSMLCRFNGHTSKFYSVAEHSVHVSRLVPQYMALEALLHDASEAYLADVPRPVKGQYPGYTIAEDAVMIAIWKALAPPRWVSWHHPDIKDADNAMLALEARELMQGLDVGFEPAEGVELVCWEPYYAKLAFMERFEELTR